MALGLFIDTETSDIPDWKTPSEGAHQPHIVELAMRLHDLDTGALRDTFTALIRPDGWAWGADNEAFKVHGITVEQCMDEGIAEAEAVQQFLAMNAQADLRIAHCWTFDGRIMRIGVKRHGGLTQEERDAVADAFKAQPYYCTMVNAKKERPGVWAKWPTLGAAHLYLVGEELEEAHRAGPDVDACARIYFALHPPKRDPVTLNRCPPPTVDREADIHEHGMSPVFSNGRPEAVPADSPAQALVDAIAKAHLT